MKNDIVKLGVVLMLFCAIAAFALAGTNLITAPRILAQRAAADVLAQQAVLPAAASFVDQGAELAAVQADYPNIQAVFQGLDEAGGSVGMVFKVAPKGYGGPITIMVGVNTEGKISGIKVLAHTETPGLGANAQKESFTSQYTGKSADTPLSVVKGSAANENEISALTAATISSRAVTNGVNQALQFFTAFGGK